MAEKGVSGQMLEARYFDNDGGLNLSDSPFRIKENQATGGGDFEYTEAGAIQKRRGNNELTTAADSYLKSRGFPIYQTSLSTRTVIRAADRVLQTIDPTSGALAILSQDTTSTNNNVFPVGTSTPTVWAPFNTATSSTTQVGGNTDDLYSIYSTTKFTKNGAVPPAGSFTGAQTAATGGAFTSSGTFAYAVTYSKTATGAESNATLDITVVTTTSSPVVTLTFSSITSVDTATYNKLNVYRSAVGGASGFTTGNLIAQLTLPVVSYADTGTSILTSQNIPRANSTVVDNSDLPTGTYNVVTLWKRRLVTANGSTLYISDINKPESWPTVNTIQINSGGPITALAVISFNTNFGNDEYLAVFKDRELYLVRGNDYTDFELSFIDAVGCANQALVVNCSGYLAWVDYRGIYLWDGAGKPIYASRLIESLFAFDGEIDKTKLVLGVGSFYRKKNVVTWVVSHKTYGENKFILRMDLRLTLPGISEGLAGRMTEGVFANDITAQPIYGLNSFVASNAGDERQICGDDAGRCYYTYEALSDAGEGINFEYTTKFLDMGTPNTVKRFHKVIVHCEQTGDYPLTLEYWANYRATEGNQSTITQSITTTPDDTTALWDIAVWDESYWDDYVPQLSYAVYNLNNSVGGNAEGKALKLRFSNSNTDQPITIYGFTVYYTVLGVRD